MALFGRKGTAPSGDEVETPRRTLAAPPADVDGRRGLDEHRAWVLSMIEPLAPLGLGLADAAGLYLCEDIRADTDLPPVPLAETDGFAISAASRATTTPVGAGEPLPAGTDTVVPAWLCAVDAAGVLRVTGQVCQGDWVRPAGADAAVGEHVARDGDLVSPRRAALLAQAGYDRLLVRPRARVVVVAVDRPAGERPAATASGSALVTGALRQEGVTVWRVAVPAGDAEAVAETIGNELIRADLVVCCGGLEEDESVLAGVLAGMGPLDVVSLAIEPGGRYGFGLVGEESVPLLAVPATAAAALVAHLALIRPVVQALGGAAAPVTTVAHPVTHALPGAQVRQFVPGSLVPHRSGASGVRPLASRGVWPARALVAADVLMDVPAGHVIRPGDPVACWPLQA
ncbi:MAG: hypothetical protein FWC46_01250 [Actinomycetia bacterium]|nr:hypothetical protein [Actinomycetes bacterium]